MINDRYEHDALSYADIEKMYNLVRVSVEKLIPATSWKVRPRGLVIADIGDAIVSLRENGILECNSELLNSDASLLIEMHFRRQFALMAVGVSFRGSSYVKIVERAFGYEDTPELQSQKEIFKRMISERRKTFRKASLRLIEGNTNLGSDALANICS